MCRKNGHPFCLRTAHQKNKKIEKISGSALIFHEKTYLYSEGAWTRAALERGARRMRRGAPKKFWKIEKIFWKPGTFSKKKRLYKRRIKLSFNRNHPYAPSKIFLLRKATRIFPKRGRGDGRIIQRHFPPCNARDGGRTRRFPFKKRERISFF